MTATWNPRAENVHSLEMLQGRGVQFALAQLLFDSSYATGGEAITVPMGTVFAGFVGREDGYTFEYDASAKKIKVYEGAPSRSGIINDDDSAATNGADLQIAVADHTADVVEENAWNGMIGRFEAINGGNADVHTNQFGTAVAATNPTFSVWDNDNAETETSVMADVYVAPGGGGLYAVTKTGLDTYVPLSNGEFLKITYDADPASNQSAVQVYYDHDATNAHERLLAVVADNLDETLTVALDLSMRSGIEVPNGIDLSGIGAVPAMFIGWD